jgi:hypothetical protein
MPHASHQYLLGQQRPQTQSVTSPKQVRHQRPGICSTARKTEIPEPFRARRWNRLRVASKHIEIASDRRDRDRRRVAGRRWLRRLHSSGLVLRSRRRNLANDWQVNSRWDGRHLKSSPQPPECGCPWECPKAAEDTPPTGATDSRGGCSLQRHLKPSIRRVGVRPWRGPGLECGRRFHYLPKNSVSGFTRYGFKAGISDAVGTVKHAAGSPGSALTIASGLMEKSRW